MVDRASVADALIADEGSPAAPPRSNGELVFEAPWESRAFGVAVALSEGGAVGWEDFRRRLIAEIGAWEHEHGGDPSAHWSYYERWLASLERLLLDGQLVSEGEIEARERELADHDEHEHDHDHGDHDHHHHHHDHDHA